MILRFIAVCAGVLQIAWILSAWVLLTCRVIGRDRPSAARFVWRETRPLYLPALATLNACNAVSFGLDWMDGITIATGLAGWWMCKDIDDPDDDRWKRRKAKLADRVGLVSGRLKVVPVTNR